MLIGWIVGRCRDAADKNRSRSRSRSEDQGDAEGERADDGKGRSVRRPYCRKGRPERQQGTAEHAGKDERPGEDAKHAGKEATAAECARRPKGPPDWSRV